MLDVLRHQDLDGVLATVVRYFGGVKLGAGGLVRAYSDSVAQALLGSDKVPLRRMLALACEAPYAAEGVVRRELAAIGAAQLVVQHGSQVQFDFRVPECDAPGLMSRLVDATQGRIGWHKPEQTG